MNDNERYKKIAVENIIFYIYFIIIALSLYDNYLEVIYLQNKTEANKQNYRQLLILIFLITTIIYIYFAYDSYKDLATNQKYSRLAFIGSLLVVISGLIFLYIASTDEYIETEISFN